jgi:hypothetical protein
VCYRSFSRQMPSKSLILVGVVSVLLIGCGNKSGLQNAAKGTGISGALEKLKGAPAWNLESVGSTANAWTLNQFDVPARGKFSIVGWAVDQEAKRAAGGVEFTIDGVPYAAEYGKPRPDVAQVVGKGLAEYTNSGYSASLTADQFPPGAHTVFVRVLSNNRKGYWEVGPYTLNFK